MVRSCPQTTEGNKEKTIRCHLAASVMPVDTMERERSPRRHVSDCEASEAASSTAPPCVYGKSTARIHIDGVRATTWQGDDYYCAGDVANALGYANPCKACRDHVWAENRTLLKELRPPDHLMSHNEGMTVYVNSAGLRQLIHKSQMPEALTLAAKVGMDLDTKYIRKEPEIVNHVQDFLGELRVATECQKQVGRYRVDLYLPDHSVALEVDEHGHRDRDPEYDRCRQTCVERALGCEFMRVNPDAPDFNVFKICARLTALVLAHHTNP